MGHADSDDIATTNQHICQRLKALRKYRGLTQKQLGEAIGVSFQQIQKYESGANRISAGRLYQIAFALEVSIFEFYIGMHIPRASSLLN